MVRYSDHFYDENYYDPVPVKSMSSSNDSKEMGFDFSSTDRPRRVSEHDFQNIPGDTNRQSQNFLSDIFSSLFKNLSK